MSESPKRFYLLPWLRINLYTRGVSLSIGKNGLGWITFGRRGIRGTVPTGIPSIYLSEAQSWNSLSRALPKQPKKSDFDVP